MTLIQRFIRYMNPSVEPKVRQEMDRMCLRSIRVISLIVLIFESISLLPYLFYNFARLERDIMISVVSVSYCIALCAFAWYLSGRMLKKKTISRRGFVVFKLFFFAAFTVWAIFADYRHYKVGDQILTFYAVNLILICFVLFRPWAGVLLTCAAFAGLYIPMYTFDGATGFHPINFIILALASAATNAVRYHNMIDVSVKTIRLTENNAALESASRRDGLTGLLNRLALEEDAGKMDGRHMTVYMVDINYFKEINDRHGHAAGDAILRTVSERLKHLYPGGYYYRYGGDEFLVLTYKPPEANYGSDTFDLMEEKYGVKVLLSIGNAQGCPENYQELFDLISAADKALYITKKRTHSAEFGGHDRRKNRS